MSRPHVVDQLSLYADGMLTAAEAERVRAHLAGCDACRAEWEALQHTLALLRSIPDEDPPEDLVESIMARINAEAAAAPVGHRWNRGARWGMAAAAAVLLLLAVGMIADRWGPRDMALLGDGSEQMARERVVVDDAAAGGVPTVGVTSAPAPLRAGDAGVEAQAHEAAGGFVPAVEVGQGAGAGSAAAVQRRVIHSATLVMRVEDVEGTYHRVIAMTEAAGGFTQEASLSSDGPGIIIPPLRRTEPGPDTQPRSAYLVLRVPTPRLTQFTNDVMALAAPGSTPDLHTSASDITTQYVDVEARMRTLKAKEGRLLEILEQADNVNDLLAVEREVWQTRSEIEALQAQIDAWDRLLDLATLHVTLHEAGVWPPDRDHGVGERLLLAFYRAVDYLVVSVETMIVGAGVLLPWAVLVAIAWLAYSRWRRGRVTP